jgi:hypothetical protein
MHTICCKDCLLYVLALLLPAFIAFIIVGAIYMNAFAYYEVVSHHGVLTGTYVSVYVGKSTTYTVEQVFSYTATSANGQLTFDNCSRAAYSFQDEGKATRASEAVVLGTSRSIYLSKLAKDDSCIDKDTRDFYLQIGVASLAFVATWAFTLIYVLYRAIRKECCTDHDATTDEIHRYERTDQVRYVGALYGDVEEAIEFPPLPVPDRPSPVTAAAGTPCKGASADDITTETNSWASTVNSLTD